MTMFDRKNLTESIKVDEATAKPRVMIVDDEPGHLSSMKSLLSEEYDVIAAQDGNEALEIINGMEHPGKLNVIISDQRMPGLTGVELFERLFSQIPDTVRIILTAHADVPVILDAVNRAKIYEFILKPFEPATLLMSIRRAINVYELKLELEEKRIALESRNQELEKFITIIAHDLRNPMQAVVLASEMLYTKYDHLDVDKRKNYAREIHQNQLRISGLLENLLKWAQSQRGTIECKPEKVDIGNVVDENIKLVELSAEKKDIKTISEIEPNTFAFADLDMTKTVIRNLVSNAVKFTETGGEVNVTAGTKADIVEISVSDNGIGMDAEALEGLFRLDVSSSKGTAGEIGSRLGLILCKEFIEKNNGTIQVTSEPGKGSCFKITLPAYPTEKGE